MQKIKPQIGTSIITNKKFTPSHSIKLRGVIVAMPEGNIFGIEFKQKHKWTHNLDGLLLEKKGYFLERKQFTITSLYIKNKDKKLFVENVKKLFYRQLISLPAMLENLKAEIKQRKAEIEHQQQSIEQIQEHIQSKYSLIKRLEKKYYTRPTIKTLEQQFNTLTKTPKIKDIQSHENYLIVNTNDLIYTKTSTIPEAFNMGAFKIFIPLTFSNASSAREIKIINYKKHVRKRISHPCITDAGRTCTGIVIENEMKQYLEKNRIDLLVFLIINFLEKPNYNNPFLDDLSFMCAQEVTIKPKNVLNWINVSYWQNNEEWDDVQFNEKRTLLISQMQNA